MPYDNTPYSRFLRLLDEQTMASPRYQKAIKKLEKKQADPKAQRDARLRKMNRLMAQEDRQLRAAQRRSGTDPK